jgi:hypothetical protein
VAAATDPKFPPMTGVDDTEPLYATDGDVFVPSEHTRGPWDPKAQHGGPVAALVARALEAVAGDGFAVTRLTIELLKPVPLTPLAVTASVVKPGRRTLGLAARVEAGGVPVVDARGVAVRLADQPVGDPPGLDRNAPLVPGPEEGHHSQFGAIEGMPVFHVSGMDVRFVGGAFDRLGPATAWLRLRRPVVDDEAPSGLVRVAAAADFGNGVSGAVPLDRWVFVNADLTVHLARAPIGEWVGLDAVTLLGDTGAGMAESVIYDDAGRVGRGAQSLILERRPGP